MRTFLFFSVAWLVTTYCSADRPNVLILFSDDHGSADLGIQGSKDIPTPQIDSLAHSGVRCTQGYISSCMCSPSRAGLLTGRSQSRFGHEINWEGSDLSGLRGLPVTEKTLANRLKAAGYRTGCVGKWHLGDVAKFHPKSRGFDEYFGHIGGSHDYLSAKQGGKGGRGALEGWDGKSVEFSEGYLTEVNGRAACEFIRRDLKQPWFLYVAFNAPHGPLQATDKYLSRFPHLADPQRRTYAAMVSALDDAVGTILAELRSLHLEENTLIFFLSDNGGPLERNASQNLPHLSGEKGSMLEGGIRTPYLVQWKAALPSGKTYGHPVSSLDVAATALAAATVPQPTDLDGVNLLPHLKGEVATAPHPVLYWRMKARDIWAIRMGEWKLVAHRAWHDLPSCVQQPRLIHLGRDPGELHDLREQEPTKFAELQSAYTAWASTLPEPLWTTDVSPEAQKARAARMLRQKAK